MCRWGCAHELVRKIREFIISGASSIWADDDDVPRGSAVDEFWAHDFSEALVLILLSIVWEVIRPPLRRMHWL